MYWASKDWRWYLGFHSFGKRAHLVSKVYKPGFHYWKTEDYNQATVSFVFPFIYKRIMLSFPTGPARGSCAG